MSSFSCFSYCLIANFLQNLGTPHFGEEQPGDMYYFSPLSVFQFGIADVTQTPTQLLTYAYTKDVRIKEATMWLVCSSQA